MKKEENIHLTLVRTMISFIEEHYASRLTVDDIAGYAAVSRSCCCKLFRKYIHTSPISFLNEYRLQKACGRLRESRQSIVEVALGCGFNNASYFSQLFQKNYGCTPRKYRSVTDSAELCR